MNITRLPISIQPDRRRVLLRPFEPTTPERSARIISRILGLSQNEIERNLKKILDRFERRHRNFKPFLLERFNSKKDLIPSDRRVDDEIRLLIGAYFSLEYAVEAASLFNPSMIWHPDQTGLSSGQRRFILSMRATGEGHISSLAFRSGIVDTEKGIIMDKISPYVTSPEISSYEDGYRAVFKQEVPLCERHIFPVTPDESRGIEDARFVQFVDDTQTSRYYATFTAYDGLKTRTMLLETADFLEFQVRKLAGPAIQNKNFALFPRKIDDRYVMLSRQDNENNYIMFSDRLHYWENKKLLTEPLYDWEFFQVGNCGPPIELEDGWLVITHGVGAMRTYVISAILLDKDNPFTISARLKEPIIEANEQEREGYVPNVVYTCGGQLYQQDLIFAYAMSDSAVSFAKIRISDLMDKLT